MRPHATPGDRRSFLNLTFWLIVCRTGDDRGDSAGTRFGRVIAFSPGINPAQQWPDAQDASLPQ